MSSTIQTGTLETSPANLRLIVRRGDGTTSEFHVVDGLSIGRTVANTIVLDGEDEVDRLHARVEIDRHSAAQLVCLNPGSTISFHGFPAERVTLSPGIEFILGATRFECRDIAKTNVPHANRVGHDCPYCGQNAELTRERDLGSCASCRLPILRTPAQTSANDRWLIPTRYGEFRYTEFIACGGMGVVLRGSHPRTHQVVAIKVIPATTAQGSAVNREVAALEAVQHPNVVRIQESGRLGCFDYIVMEWMAGESLQRVIDRHQIQGRFVDFQKALAWLKQTCCGLSAIQTAGLLHRDIKPSNILLSGDDTTAKIGDFGLSKPFDGEMTVDLTTVGHIPGTYAYLAPELLLGTQAADPRSDQFSLGVTFYELLTGHRPLGSWAPASSINSSIPRSFDRILNRLLAPRPDQRYPNLTNLYSDLESLASADGSPDHVAPSEAGAPFSDRENSPFATSNSVRGIDGQHNSVPVLRPGETSVGLRRASAERNLPPTLSFSLGSYFGKLLNKLRSWRSRGQRLVRSTLQMHSAARRDAQNEVRSDFPVLADEAVAKFRRPWNVYGSLCLAFGFAFSNSTAMQPERVSDASAIIAGISILAGAVLLAYGILDRILIHRKLPVRSSPKLVYLAWCLFLGPVGKIFWEITRAAVNESNKAQMLATASKSAPIKAIPIKAGHLWLQVPEAMTIDPELKKLVPDAVLFVSNRSSELYMIILEESRQDFVDPVFKNYSETIVRSMQDRMGTAAVAEQHPLTIDGLQAHQYELRGVIDGRKLVYLITTGQTARSFFSVVGWTRDSKYEQHRPTMQEIIRSLRNDYMEPQH